MTAPKKNVTPLVIVLSALSIIEIAITVLYPRLSEVWERIPVLFVILAVPIAIVSGFLYLWVRKPGHLFPPSEFGTGDAARLKLDAYACPVSDPLPRKSIINVLRRATSRCPACGRPVPEELPENEA